MNPDNNPAYIIQTAPDGYRRLITTRNIEQGTTLLIDKPIVHAPTIMIADSGYRAWAIAQQLLTERDLLTWFLRKEFTTTPQSWDYEDEEIARRLGHVFLLDYSVIKYLYFTVVTNQVCYFDSSGRVSGSGLYEEICFSNHSCSPNSAPASVPGALDRHIALFAQRKIHTGEEVTWNYATAIPLEALPTRKRREVLRIEFGFDCQCVRCGIGGR